jgi:hypothetical protein
LVYCNTLSVEEYRSEDFEEIMNNYKYWDDLEWNELFEPADIG